MVSFSRRHFFFGSLATATLAHARPIWWRPNIVLVVADDLAAWMLGCYGNRDIQTPNIDRLARGGTRFLNNFVVTPICSASRATMFTGRVPRQHGIQDFLTPHPIEKPPQGQVAPPASFANEVMLSDVLAGVGYRCGYVGKWHMGNDENPGHKFGYTYTMGGGSSPYQNPAMYLNGSRVEEKGYLPELITRRAGAFLDQQTSQQPFFLVVSHLNPHTPYDGHPSKYYDMYAKSTFERVGYENAASNALREKEMLGDIVGNLRKCAAATTALDDQIPPLLNKLRERGVWDNTLVVFTGDNGYLLGRHGLWSKGLASDPINMYDEVMRTPMIWNWPGQVPVEAARPEMVSFVDLMPSLCVAAGTRAPEAHFLSGRSYLPVALGKEMPAKEPWRNLVFGHFRNTEMARDPRFKLILRNEGEGPNEFYDLRADPRERVNQYQNGQYVTVRDQLTVAIEQWRKKYS